MKRRHKNLIQLAILAALSLFVILTAYIREISWPETEKDRKEISVIFREWESGIWTEERRGMEKAAADFGAELRFLTLQESNSAREQQLLVEQELKNGADGLILIPAGPDVLDSTAQMRRAIPRVTMESAFDENSLPVTLDNQKIGHYLAAAAMEDFLTGSVALLVNSVPGSSGVQERLNAAKEILTEAGISILQCDDRKSWESLINQADFCILPEPAFLSEILDDFEEQQRHIPLYTAGYSQKVTTGLENGQIAAAVIWSGYGEGYQAVEQAVFGEQAKLLEIPVILVRKEDMYESENQKILFPIGN